MGTTTTSLRWGLCSARVLCVLLLLAVAGSQVTAQTPAEASSKSAVKKQRTKVVGYVRDSTGRPIAKAALRVRGGRRTRSTRSGRYTLYVRRGRRTIAASRRLYTKQAKRVKLRSRTRRINFTLRKARKGPRKAREGPRFARPAGRQNSADRLIFWTRCDAIASLSDAELDSWKARGVDGFVCMGHHLVGGTQDYTADPRASLAGPRYSLQRSLATSNVIRHAAARGMKAYLGFYAVNSSNRSTPLVEWFDEPGWRNTVLPRARDLTGAAKMLGFAGVAVDQELYGDTGRTATWEWRYPGGSYPEATVRQRVKERGQQLMQVMTSEFPGLEVVGYDTRLPESWRAFTQAGGRADGTAWTDDVRIDLWDGLSSVPGYGAIRLMDSTFYKTPRMSGVGWDAALQYDTNRLFSLFSRRFSGWDYAASRFHISPFAWIDRGPDSDEGARSTGEVAAQLMAFRRWGTGGEFANFAYGGMRGFDYDAYVPAMRAASSPGEVDSQPPTLSLTTPTSGTHYAESGPSLTLGGYAVDNLALRSVRWRDDRGNSGIAKLDWIVDSGDHRSGWRWRMRWVAAQVPIWPGSTTITLEAEDIKGLVVRRSLTIRR